ncbi:CAP domain-containing protein [Piscinibacter sakaiensis]|uniref:CAP domain-containing protein n=1 Tax=Piscinibacter sakaiensis TaxID=1547922 RepID=UPI003AAAA7DC
MFLSSFLRASSLLFALALFHPAQASDSGSRSADTDAFRLHGDTRAVRPANCGIDRFEARFLELINRMRAVGASCGAYGNFGPASPVRWNARLTSAAHGHVAEMASTHHFHHTSSRTGMTVAQRIAAAGYEWGEYAENISAGGSSPEEIVARWHRSPRHCANLMNPYFTDVGAACMPAEQPIRYRTFWTMDLAGP